MILKLNSLKLSMIIDVKEEMLSTILLITRTTIKMLKKTIRILNKKKAFLDKRQKKSKFKISMILQPIFHIDIELKPNLTKI